MGFEAGKGACIVILPGQPGADDLKSVQRMGIAAGVDAGIQNAVACLGEVAADVGEQGGAVARVNQHLQPFAMWCRARFDDGWRCAVLRILLHMLCQALRVPGNGIGIVPQKIARIQCLP